MVRAQILWKDGDNERQKDSHFQSCTVDCGSNLLCSVRRFV